MFISSGPEKIERNDLDPNFKTHTLTCGCITNKIQMRGIKKKSLCLYLTLHSIYFQDGSWHPVPKEDEEAKRKKKEEEAREAGVDLVDLSDDDGEGGSKARAAAGSPSQPATCASNSDDEGATVAPAAPANPSEIECIDLE